MSYRQSDKTKKKNTLFIGLSTEIRSQEIGADTRKSCNELQSGLSQQTTGENLVVQNLSFLHEHLSA